ncbi:MAG: hypothetical protein K9K67_16310 [Bacteriovoracaceae bacterium]|nr:hypothetical protein [Bacteriovoracaceae bacterium]
MATVLRISTENSTDFGILIFSPWSKLKYALVVVFPYEILPSLHQEYFLSGRSFGGVAMLRRTKSGGFNKHGGAIRKFWTD